MDIQHQEFLISALDGYQWWVSHQVQGLQSQPGHHGERKISCSCSGPGPVSILTQTGPNHHLSLDINNHLSKHKIVPPQFWPGHPCHTAKYQYTITHISSVAMSVIQTIYFSYKISFIDCWSEWQICMLFLCHFQILN